MHRGILTTVILIISTVVYGQSASGLFLTVACDKNIPKHTTDPKGKPICITEFPIVEVQGFQRISELVRDGTDVYFDLTLTQEAYKKTNNIASRLTNSSFALVVDGEVFAVISFKEMKNKIVQRFSGSIANYVFIERAHTKLATLVESPAATQE